MEFVNADIKHFKPKRLSIKEFLQKENGIINFLYPLIFLYFLLF